MGFTTVVQYTYALSSLKFIVSSSCENIKIKTGMLYSGGLNGSSVCAGVVLVNPICPQKHGKKKKKKKSYRYIRCFTKKKMVVSQGLHEKNNLRCLNQ